MADHQPTSVPSSKPSGEPTSVPSARLVSDVSGPPSSSPSSSSLTVPSAEPSKAAVAVVNSLRFTYVGSFVVGHGPAASSGVRAFSCVEACAFLFGGSASQYRGSTEAPDISGNCFYDVWAGASGASGVIDADRLASCVAYDSRVGCRSAFVSDHGVARENFCYRHSDEGAAVPRWAWIALAVGASALLVLLTAVFAHSYCPNWLLRRRAPLDLAVMKPGHDAEGAQDVSELQVTFESAWFV